MSRPDPMQRALLDWFDRSQRDLPWRRTRDPYAIWVSETMLQQTRVETAIAYYGRFLARFPTIAALAAAEIDDVLAVWAGLGYYRRARHLHAAARRVAAEHGGNLPRTAVELRALPGLGAYSSGALASIAFGERVPAVDGNVQRVLARWRAWRGDPRTGALRRRIDAEAAALVAATDRPGDWNQALMELGALVCTPGSPRCHACPVATQCAAREAGIADRIPPARRRRAEERVRQAAVLAERRGRLLFVKRANDGLLAGLYELPTVELTETAHAAVALASHVREATGVSIEVGAPMLSIQHSITHRRIELSVFGGRAGGGVRGARALWLSPDDALLRGVTAATRKILATLPSRPDRCLAPRSKGR